MRMAQEGPSAADFLNTAGEGEIADVLYTYGEERQSRRVARAIVAARPLETTGQLAAVVRRALGYKPGQPKDPATRSFQAIRIHVNAELDELREALAGAERLLREGAGWLWSASTAWRIASSSSSCARRAEAPPAGRATCLSRGSASRRLLHRLPRGYAPLLRN